MRPFAIPAMANVHSHAFQRDLRGLGERSGRPDDDFWSWREGMYALAERLDPDGIREVASRVYAEMAAAGYGAVGEFHYVHHQPDGTPYADPNAMALAVSAAAQDAGLRCVMLPAAYHRGGRPRFTDPHVDTFLARVDALSIPHGIAAHSVRAVPAEWLEAIARYSDERELVRHVHASEQPRELEECQAEHGCSPRAAPPSSRARPPRATSATASRPRSPMPTPVCRSRSGPTRTSCSTRSRRCASWRRSRGGSG